MQSFQQSIGDPRRLWVTKKFLACGGRTAQAAGVPGGRMAGIILSGTDLAQVFDLGGALARMTGCGGRSVRSSSTSTAPIARCARHVGSCW